MAQYRTSLMPEDAGKKQAKGANICLFRAIWPHHDTVEKPEDKATNPAAYDGWTKLRDRLREGRLWLAVRDLFGGDGAFLALPPQCVPDRHIVKMPAKVFESWLSLLDVAWRALDAQARQTLDSLVQLSLAGQPLPDDVLALETFEGDTSTPPISLSAMFAGWSAADRQPRGNEDGVIATLTQREAHGDATALEPPSTATGTTSRAEETGDAEVILQKETMRDVGDGLFDD